MLAPSATMRPYPYGIVDTPHVPVTHHVTVHPTFDEAKADVRARLERTVAHLRQELAVAEQALRGVDTTYVPLPPLADELAALQTQLTEALVRLKAAPGQLVVGPLRIDNNYLQRSDPNLWVFTLPEYAPVTRRFDAASCDVIRHCMHQAGIAEAASEWNGPGAITWSVHTAANAAAPQPLAD